MSNEYSKEYVKKITTDGSGTSFIIEKWDKFLLNYSCRPNDELFPKKKLKLTNYNKLYEDGLKAKLAEEYDLSLEEVELIWVFAYSEEHSCGLNMVYAYFDDLASLYGDLKKISKSRKARGKKSE